MNRYPQNMVVASVLAIVAAGVSAQEAPKDGAVREQAKRVERFPNVKLMTETGAEVRFVDDLVKDKVVVINFMDTTCDELCEKVTKNLQQVQQSLGPRLGKDVFIYSITIDSKNDTPPVLKKYRDDHNTNAGWHYFWGEAGDIAALRRGTGMTAMSPELRQKLKLAPLDSAKSPERQHPGMLLVGNARAGEWQKVDALSKPDHILQIVEKLIAASVVATPASAGAAAKTIEAKGGNVWQPTPLNVAVGDVIEWRMNDNSGATFPSFPGHGVRITNWDAVKDHVEVETVPGQQTFNATTGKNDTESKTVGQLLLRLKIKSVPAAPAEITYNCTFHGVTMAGKVSIAAASAPAKTIEAKAGNVWQPTPLNVAVGDVIEWRMNDNSGATFPGFPGHGVRITNWDAVKDHVEVETVPGQQTFNATTGKNDTESKTVGQLLLRLKIKSVPPAPAEIRYNCTFHGVTMAGKVSIAAASAPAKTIEAKAGNVWQPTPLNVAVGDVIEWRMNDNSGATFPGFPGHGVRITNWDAVKDHVEVETVPGQQTFNATTGKNDTESKTVGQLLLRLKIKSVPPAPAEIRYNCTFHGATMAGRVSVAPSSADLRDGADEEFVAKMSPSMQRRMLRFVNRAHRPEDLMKSPQEFRATSEHLPVDVQKRKSDTKKGFAREMAAELINRRPLDGYRDVRECLPIYKSTGGLEQLSGVLKSLGPAEFGRWDEMPGRIPSVMHAALMNTGKVLFITDTKATVVWDPAGDPPPPPEVLSDGVTGLEDILYCCGQSFLSDGRLLAVGGGGSSSGAESSIHAWKFNPATLKWSRTRNNMAFRRWYPTAVTLGDEPGRVLVAAGSMGSDPAPRMEVYSETTDSFTEITASGPTGNLLFEPTYPGLHLLPGGEIFHAPTGFFDCVQSPVTGTTDPTAIFRFTSPTTGSWTRLGANQRLKGMSALLFDTTSPFIQGLVVGGGDVSKNKTAQTIDLSSLSPAWSREFPLLEARIHPNLVVLPDGAVFICGGKESSATTPPEGGKCELYTAKTGMITPMDDIIVPRHYHSVALLLPDARVMVAGGADDGGCTISTRPTIEVFSPPYLFKGKGSRPVISSANRVVEHGATIEIKTPAASEIQRVVFARPAAVTHQTDSEQRVLPLSFRVTGADSIEATAPGGTGANSIAPRGHYMLFILNQEGVPSVCKWIFLR